MFPTMILIVVENQNNTPSSGVAAIKGKRKIVTLSFFTKNGGGE